MKHAHTLKRPAGGGNFRLPRRPFPVLFLTLFFLIFTLPACTGDDPVEDDPDRQAVPTTPSDSTPSDSGGLHIYADTAWVLFEHVDYGADDSGDTVIDANTPVDAADAEDAA